MVAKKTQNVLANRIRNRADKAMAKHATDEVDYGFLELPPGIKNGIARLDKMGLDEVQSGDNKGQVRWFAIGTVIEPKEITLPDGQVVTCKGRATRQSITFLDNEDFDKNFARALNEVKKFEAQFTEEDDLDTLLKICESLQEEQPYFRFSTSQSEANGKYAARVWQNWYGTKGLENYEPNEEGVINDESEEEELTPTTIVKPKKGVVINKPKTKTKEITELEPELEPEEVITSPKPVKVSPTNKVNIVTKPTTKKKEPEPEPEEEGQPFDEFGDLESLIQAAMEDDDAAQEKLEELAIEAGVSQEDIANAGDWEEVGNLIRGTLEATQDEDESIGEQAVQLEDEEDSEPPIPELGDVYTYTGDNGKSQNVKVTMVNAKRGTANVKGLKSKQEYRGVKFSDLVPIE